MWPAGALLRTQAARLARRLALASLWAVLGAAITLVAAVGAPSLLGFRSLTVMSGSMEPAINTGDVVVARPVAPLTARPGDVVTFKQATAPDRLITHRVRSVRVDGAMAEFETKGDANNTTETWRVPVRGRIGKVEYRVPSAGYLLHWSRSPYWRIGLVAIPSIALGWLTLVWAWRGPQDSPEVPEAPSPDPV